MSSTAQHHRLTELPPVNVLPVNSSLRWLREGWGDVKRVGSASLIHGVLVVLLSLAILSLTFLRWELVIIAASCFLITGPFLATGLYALSRDLENHDKPTLKHAIHAWRVSSTRLYRFGILLFLICCLWVAVSSALFYLFVDVKIEDPVDFLRYVFTQHDGLFVMWCILGGMVAATVFGISVITIPLLVDRDLCMWDAIRVSVNAVGNNPHTMGWWSLAIIVLTGVGFLTFTLGFLVLYPVMGHASWHVYRDLVDAEGLPKYEGGEEI
ncbi:MAG: DUF2189 domain-containing protein [Gammaproteobacteria bacterium]